MRRLRESPEQGWHGNIKRLQQDEAAQRRRMGDYRVLFDVAGRVIVIRRGGDRKDVYDESDS
jgi:mRNA-degrading endonuclease RelE of RelBE toxin-antitoxin system